MDEYFKMFSEDETLKPLNVAVSAKMGDCLKVFQAAMPKNAANRRATQSEALHLLIAHALSCKTVQDMLQEKNEADLAQARLVVEKLKKPLFPS